MHVLSWPAYYALELTPDCNNRCPGCSNVYADDRTPPPLSATDWEAVLAHIGPEAVQFRLTGGEPTLHPEFLCILDAATSYDAWVTVFTNGRWSDPDSLVRRLRGKERLSGLLVSLHGATPASHAAFSGVRDSFQETVANIRLAVAHGIPVALSTIITRQNLHEIDAVVDLGQQLEVQHVAFNRYLGSPLPAVEPRHDQLRQAVAQIEALAEQGLPVKYGVCIPQCFTPNRSEGCLAGAAYVSIDPWGRMHPCTHSPTVAGSLLEFSAQELWHGPAMNAWRQWMPQECTACAAFSVCHGGCRAIYELRADQRDPLRADRLHTFARDAGRQALPANGKPVLRGRVRPESFGYVVLGSGQAVAVRPGAHELLAACNGQTTLVALSQHYGQAGLDLLGELWDQGLLTIL
jgi:radical SAM protein with 4Fe4S-binding SPASM domain